MIFLNPLTDDQRSDTLQNITSLPFYFAFYIFFLGHKTINRRAARWLIVLHPKQNLESELKWQTCSD